MAIFLTGGTGYLGSYVIPELLDLSDKKLLLLTRAKDRQVGIEKLWRALQLNMDGPAFHRALTRIEFIPGDLSQPDLGISEADRAKIVSECDSILHMAASLNRKSAKACFNANLKGTLSMCQLARETAEGPLGLKRFSFVSTSAVMGKREHECVTEDGSIEWDRSDYDPYARTKKFCEHMVSELLPDISRIIFRPSTVMGDSRHPRISQFDMIRATCFFADLPAVPIGADTRQDIVNADFVGKAMSILHLKEQPDHGIYHLSAGASSPRAEQLATAMLQDTGKKPPRFMKFSQKAFARLVQSLASGPRSQISLLASLLHVFLPYVTNDVVFDNTRVVEELGFAPAPFTNYFGALYQWAKSNNFTYPYLPLPAVEEEQEAA